MLLRPPRANEVSTSAPRVSTGISSGAPRQAKSEPKLVFIGKPLMVGPVMAASRARVAAGHSS